MNIKRLGIGGKLTLVVCGVLVLVFAIVTVVQQRVVHGLLDEQAERFVTIVEEEHVEEEGLLRDGLVAKGESLTELLSYSGASLLRCEDNEAISQLAARTAEDRDVAQVLFRDARGKALADEGAITEDVEWIEREITFNGERLGSVALALQLDRLNEAADEVKTHSETLSLSIQESRVATGRQFVVTNTILGLGALALLSATVYLVSNRMIVRGLQPLVAGLRAVADGDFTHHFPMRKIHCSSRRKCGKTDCPEYGRESNCWNTVGSNAIAGNIFCPSILSGKFKSCHECPVLKEAVRDELDEIASWFNTFVARMSGLINQIRVASSGVLNSANALTGTADQLTLGAHQTKTESANMSNAAGQVSGRIDAMAESAKQMSTNIATVAASVEEITSSIGQISQSAEQASEVAENATRLTESSDQSIRRLGSAADEIGKVVEVIQDIAEQTNLLALNATIEAARAGTAGKGFAVVATEVKELAKQTTHAIEDIRQRIEAIQGSTGDVVREISEIGGVIRKVNDVSRAIASSVEGQSSTTRSIAGHVSSTSEAAGVLASGVAESATASREITDTITTVNDATQRTAQGAVQVQSASSQLSTLAGDLESLVDQFKVQV